MYTLTQTCIHTIHVYNIMERDTTYVQRNTYVHIPQFIHTHAWAVTHVVCLYGCVYVCICVSQTRVYEYVNPYLYHTSSRWHKHTYRQYTWTTYIQSDTCTNASWFIHIHAWVAAHVVLSAWIYVRVYGCVTVCMCRYVYVCIYQCMHLHRTPAHWRTRTIHNARTQRTCEETHVYTYQNSYTHTPKWPRI